MFLYKKSLLFILLFYSILLQAQYNPVEPPSNIKTVQIFNPQTNDNTPIIKLGSNEYLLFLFDDLNAGYKRYNYTIEHRNADWSPSNIFQSEYLKGFNNDYVRTFKNSFNTYQKYTNYQIQFPNRDMSVKLAGNYLLKVYTDNPNKPLFTRRFAVYQDNTEVGMRESRYINPKIAALNQRIETVVNSNTFNLVESPNASKLFVMKNNNWSDYLTNIEPNFSRSSQLTYNSFNWVFDGGSQFYWFDNKNLEVIGLTTERSFRKDSVYHTVLHPDFPKANFPYDDFGDINGNYYIRNNRYGNEYLAASEADYSWVYFALAEFDSKNGEYLPHIVGAFNNWEISSDSQLKLDNNTGLWVTEYFLKQGYYNYQYVAVNTKTGKVEPSYISGSFWQTENLYQGLFYFRPWGERYDILMGYGEVRSMR